jgi:hypothetical protein
MTTSTTTRAIELQHIIIKLPNGCSMTYGVSYKNNVERIKQFYLKQVPNCGFVITDIN